MYGLVKIFVYSCIGSEKYKNLARFEKQFLSLSRLNKLECSLFWPEGDAISLGKSVGKDNGAL